MKSPATNPLGWILATVLTIGVTGCASDRHPQEPSIGSSATQTPPEPPSPPPTPEQRVASSAEAARRDIAAGRLALKTYGLEPAPQPVVTLFRARLGVELIDSAGCVLTPFQLDEFEAYNRPMRAEIARRFGPDALENLRAEAYGFPPLTTQPASRPRP